MTSRGLTHRNHPRRDLLGSGKPQQTFSGTDTFLRRKATREVAGADVVVSGLPFDLATTFRPAPDLGPRPFERLVFSWQNCCPMPIPSISILLMSLQLLIGGCGICVGLPRPSGRRH